MAEIEGGRIEKDAIVIELNDIINVISKEVDADKTILADEKRDILDALNKVKATGERMKQARKL